MVAGAPYRLWSVNVCGLLSLVVLQVVGVSRARASCGDWLAHPGESRMAANDKAVSQQQPAEQSVLKQDRGSKRLPISKPCNGPYCRSAPFHPVPAAPVSISLQSDRLALFRHVDVELTPRAQFHFGGQLDACASRGFPSRIDHPPRV
jgi:hypothetical protein